MRLHTHATMSAPASFRLKKAPLMNAATPEIKSPYAMVFATSIGRFWRNLPRDKQSQRRTLEWSASSVRHFMEKRFHRADKGKSFDWSACSLLLHTQQTQQRKRFHRADKRKSLDWSACSLLFQTQQRQSRSIKPAENYPPTLLNCSLFPPHRRYALFRSSLNYANTVP